MKSFSETSIRSFLTPWLSPRQISSLPHFFSRWTTNHDHSVSSIHFFRSSFDYLSGDPSLFLGLDLSFLDFIFVRYSILPQLDKHGCR